MRGASKDWYYYVCNNEGISTVIVRILSVLSWNKDLDSMQ